MASTVAWMSFDAEQQRRTQLMMAALASQGTVDELGLGPIRDLIAGTLHPGLSVLHTRAKYFLFLPRIYGSLTGGSADRLVDMGKKREGKLASELAAYYKANPGQESTGIIGRNTLEHAKQPASTAYWPLLGQLGIRTIRGSVAQYCRELEQAQQQRSARSVLHSEDELDRPQVNTYWHELPPEDKFAGFELSRKEALWLRDRFLGFESSRPAASISLVSHLLGRRTSSWVTGLRRAWDHPLRDGFPSDTAAAMWLGRDLDRLAHGARIVYNYLCADRRPDHGAERDEQLERYSSAMRDWQDEIADGLPNAARIAELDQWGRQKLEVAGAGRLALTRWHQAVVFLSDWRILVEGGSELLASPDAAELITRRESTIKPGRARLVQADRLRAWGGDSGYSRFDYNWGVANRLLADVHHGLGSDFVQGAS